MTRPRTYATVATILMMLNAAQLPAQPTDEIKKTAECGVLGLSIFRNGDKFPSDWREMSLPLMMGAVVLAGGFEIPFRDDPVYRASVRETENELQSATPSPASPAYASRFSKCNEWAEELARRIELRKKDGK